jgi:hypothetical protein
MTKGPDVIKLFFLSVTYANIGVTSTKILRTDADISVNYAKKFYSFGLARVAFRVV